MSRGRPVDESAGLSLASRFKGLKAVHFIGDTSRVDRADPHGVGRVENLGRDGVFAVWSPDRWAARMKADRAFVNLNSNEGRVTVNEAGVYLVYAQVNYLDERDVNGFQVMKSDEKALAMCTTMTHTAHATTKANTCFTQTVAFLEAGDVIYVRDLEQKRFSVVLPAHTFFGLVQLSKFT